MSGDGNIKKLLEVEGFKERKNDIVYTSPKTNTTSKLNFTVFFGGDVQVRQVF